MQEYYGEVGSSMNSSPTIRWKKGELIGCGAHARVYKGQNLDSGELIAVKEVLIAASRGSREQAQDSIKALEVEINILSKLSHRNIVQYLGTAREEHTLNILLEYIPCGSLSALLGEFGPFTELVIQKYTKQLLQGLEYLHKNNIMHRDIKGANILVDKDRSIKLADFGASKRLLELDKVTGAKSLQGTTFWMAPEVIRQTGHNLSADIWSVGCTVIEMATGKPPWGKQFEEEEATLYHIATTKSHPPIPDHLSSEAKDFLQKCLEIEPKLRPTASELLEHPFVVGIHIYDVFLSFRGQDVRNTLANELFQSLQNEGLYVFLDSERIEKGDNIGMSLEEAIKDSSLFIPIFSSRYASSAWCLRELSFMWRCKSRRAKTKIIPLFYDVEPWHVRYPDSEKSPYAEALKKHTENKRQSKEEIDEWKKVLHEVSSLSGWQLPGKTIPVIVKEITALFGIKGLQSATHLTSPFVNCQEPSEPNLRPSASELLQHPLVVGDHREPHPLGRPAALAEYDSNNEKKDYEREYYFDIREKDDELEHNSESSSEYYSDNGEVDDELEHDSELSSDSSHLVGHSARWSPTRVSEPYGGLEIQEYVNHQSAHPNAAPLPLHEEIHQYPPSLYELLMAYAFQAEQLTPERVSSEQEALLTQEIINRRIGECVGMLLFSLLLFASMLFFSMMPIMKKRLLLGLLHSASKMIILRIIESLFFGPALLESMVAIMKILRPSASELLQHFLSFIVQQHPFVVGGHGEVLPLVSRSASMLQLTQEIISRRRIDFLCILLVGLLHYAGMMVIVKKNVLFLGLVLWMVIMKKNRLLLGLLVYAVTMIVLWIIENGTLLVGIRFLAPLLLAGVITNMEKMKISIRI